MNLDKPTYYHVPCTYHAEYYIILILIPILCTYIHNYTYIGTYADTCSSTDTVISYDFSEATFDGLKFHGRQDARIVRSAQLVNFHLCMFMV